MLFILKWFCWLIKEHKLKIYLVWKDCEYCPHVTRHPSSQNRIATHRFQPNLSNLQSLFHRHLQLSVHPSCLGVVDTSSTMVHLNSQLGQQQLRHPWLYTSIYTNWMQCGPWSSAELFKNRDQGQASQWSYWIRQHICGALFNITHWFYSIQCTPHLLYMGRYSHTIHSFSEKGWTTVMHDIEKKVRGMWFNWSPINVTYEDGIKGAGIYWYEESSFSYRRWKRFKCLPHHRLDHDINEL